MDKDGNVDIYLRLIGDLGLDETVLIEGTESTDGIEETSASSNKATSAKAVPNTHNHT